MRIGFIGVGSIGGPMAQCLLRAGLDMIVCDKNQTALARFAAAGAEVSDLPAPCAAADMIILMVATDAQAEATLLGAEGILAALAPGHLPLVAVMSTVLPATIARLGTALRARGLTLIDAPVSGGVVRAEQGKLTILAGGEAADLERARPVLSLMGSDIHHCGPLGSGAAFKLLNNVMGVASTYLMTEVLQMARRQDLDLDLLGRVMDVSSGRNFATPDLAGFATMLSRYRSDLGATRANVEVCRKDLAHALSMAAENGVRAPFLAALASALAGITYEEQNASWSELAG